MRSQRFIVGLAIVVACSVMKVQAQAGGTAAVIAGSKSKSPANMGSTYVPLDSWVYPTIDRLAALGYVQTSFAGQRPWTRMECARLVSEAEERAAENSDSEAGSLFRSLRNEFTLELQREAGAPNAGFQIESIYTRVLGVSGKPLVDGYHFAQTVSNDFGRPYGQGANSYDGAALRAVAGRLAFYIRGEYQHSGNVLQPSPAAQAAIAAADFTPTASAGPASNVSRFRLLDAYASVIFKNNQLSFGKQSLWWGPGNGGAALFSDNSAPITMLRYDRVSPFKLPGFLGVLGPMRLQFFVGQLEGHQFVNIPINPTSDNTHVVGTSGVSLNPQPYIHGGKMTLKPTPNLEFSVSRTVIFGGPGFPVTFGSFWRSLVSTSGANVGRIAHDPGDRRIAFDVSYRIPMLRDWLTFYCDSFTDDEAFPLAYPTHSAWQPGIYLPKLPYLHKLDFRAEGAITPARLYPGYFYENVHYLDGYTNDRQLMAGWVGRQGNGIQLWSNYWFSGRNSLQVGYRSVSVDHSFLQGGQVHDFHTSTNLAVGSNFALQASVQYERWKFPLLAARPVSNVATSVQFSYTPHWSAH